MYIFFNDNNFKNKKVNITCILIAINIFVYFGMQVDSSKQIQQMIQRHNEYINHLQKVLLQIETKTYGKCIETGKLIEKEKLLALPILNTKVNSQTYITFLQLS